MNDIDKQLSLLIGDHMTEYVIAFAKILDNEVSASQYYILQTIEDNGPKTSSEIAALLGVSLPAITNLTNKLESKGYLERMAHPTDRRTILLNQTEAGSALVIQLREKHMKLSEALINTFEDEDKLRLIQAYEKMIVAVRKEAGTSV